MGSATSRDGKRANGGHGCGAIPRIAIQESRGFWTSTHRVDLRLIWVVLVIVIPVIVDTPATAQSVPGAIVTEGIPAVPVGLVRQFARYRQIPGAEFAGWFAGRREILLLTGSRTGGTSQVFVVVTPGDAWHQMTSFRERVRGVAPRPKRNQFAFAQDAGGDERFRLFLFDAPSSRFQRLADSHSHQEKPRWSHDGRLLAYSSDARNGEDRDVYVVDPAVRSSARRLLEVSGRGFVGVWSPDDARVIVTILTPQLGVNLRIVSVAPDHVEPIEIRPNALRPDGGSVQWSPDGRSLYWTTADNSEFRRLARYDLGSGMATCLTDAIAWDVEDFALADDGQSIVFVANEDGRSRVYLLDLATGRSRRISSLPAGQVSAVAFRPGSQEFGFHLETPGAPSHIYSYLPRTRQLVRWTHGDPEGLRFVPAAEPELIRYRSFDGKEIPAFLFRPAAKFTGRRPVLINIHGGPYAQFRPGFLGQDNFLVDDLGIALLYPNVRGSSGYGRAYSQLDDGARREGAVADIGALLDWIATQPDLDPSRVAVTGGSYGGFMSLAVLVRYGERVKAGICRSGIADFVTLLEAKSGLVKDAVRAEFGNETDPKMRAWLKELSPLTHSDKIRSPLLVIHGRNDSRVPIKEAERIVAAVRKNGSPVWAIYASNEGHEWTHRENLEYSKYAEILFLQRYLLCDTPRK